MARHAQCLRPRLSEAFPILVACLLVACGTVTGKEDEPDNGENGGNGGPALCEEGERRCLDESTAERCSEEGEWEPVPCATGTVCDDGYCLPVSCEPGERRCKDALTAEECSEIGTRWIAEPCPEPGACTEDGVCVSYVCWPHETRCASEEMQETCASDGSGWTGQFCPDGELCLGSSCATPVCEPGESVCESDTHIRVCNSEGSGWEVNPCPTPGGCSDDACVVYACEPGERRCASSDVAEVCAEDGSGWIAEPCDSGEICASGYCAVPVCEPRESRCIDESTVETCLADGSGWQETDCGPSATCVDGECVAEVICSPGAAGCYDETTLGTCNAEGTGYMAGASCPPGETCSGGVCSADVCDSASVSHLGCEFWPVVLPNVVAESFRDYVVAVVTNPGDLSAQVELFGPDGSLLSQADVQPGSSREIHLPWNAMSPVVSADGDWVPLSRRDHIAYRLASSRPVAVWQFNPLHAELPSGCQSDEDCPGQDVCIVDRGVCDGSDLAATNDAMLLLPTSALGTRYVVSSLPHTENEERWMMAGFPLYSYRSEFPSLVAVAAVESGQTEVTVTSRSALAAGDGLPERSGGSPFTLSLAQHEVVQLATMAAGTPEEVEDSSLDPLFTYVRQYPASDPTGSLITSSKPIAVYVGFHCRNVPFDSRYCDHIADQLLPETAWGHQVVAGRSQTTGMLSYGDVWRVTAAKDGTQLSFMPSEVHGPVTLQAGDHLQLRTNTSFMVQSQGSSHPIYVSQYLTSREARDADTGDPAQTTVPAVSHYRTSHAVYVPSSFGESHATIVRPSGAAVTIDGVPAVASWDGVGTSGYEVARVSLAPGTRRIVGALPIGVSLYGHHEGASYAAPGGVDLAP